MSEVRVLVVDDQRVVREGLQMLLGLLDGVTVVGAACDGREALDLVAADPPDVVLMDLNMPRMDGIEATRLIKRRRPETTVVAFTCTADALTAQALVDAGASCHFDKLDINALVAYLAGLTWPAAAAPAKAA